MGGGVAWIDLGLEQLVRDLQVLDRTRVQVGVVGEAASRPTADGQLKLGELALIQELGTARIPARPVIHPELHGDVAREEAVKVARAVISFENVDQALEAAGERIARSMRDRILRGDLRPNAAETVRKKGFDHPLIDTSELLGAIGHQLVREGGGILDAGAVIGDFEEFHVGDE